jgi:hypothetical protein
MAAIALLTAIGAALLTMTRPAIRDAASITYCRDLYGNALTLADSIAVDAVYPVDRGVVSRDRIRCGALRAEGRVD